VFWLSDAPQSEQKFEFAWLECPHATHTRDRWAPQLTQNLLPSDASALQNGHSIDTPTAKSEAQYDKNMLDATAGVLLKPSMITLSESSGRL
jgi:hypothetical protein